MEACGLKFAGLAWKSGNDVTPYGGVWIEISGNAQCQQGTQSHALWRRVD